MNLTIFGATGMVGKQLVNQALFKGYAVTAFGRNIESLIDQDNRNPLLFARKGYVLDAKDVQEALRDADAVISVLGGAFDGSDQSRSLGIKNIVSQMKTLSISRIVALGGLGVLQADENTLLLDSPDYPAEYLPVGQEHKKAWEHLKASGLDWTFFCPPNILEKEATGMYTTAVDYPPQPNAYHIHAGDLAMAMLKAVSEGQFLGQRVGISN